MPMTPTSAVAVPLVIAGSYSQQAQQDVMGGHVYTMMTVN